MPPETPINSSHPKSSWVADAFIPVFSKLLFQRQIIMKNFFGFPSGMPLVVQFLKKKGTKKKTISLGCSV